MIVNEFLVWQDPECHVLVCKERNRAGRMVRTLRHGKDMGRADQMRGKVV